MPAFSNYDNRELEFKFIPKENPKNEIQFKEDFCKDDKFIKVKKYVAKKLNKNVNDLLLIMIQKFLHSYQTQLL